jgi:hypothetical protein
MHLAKAIWAKLDEVERRAALARFLSDAVLEVEPEQNEGTLSLQFDAEALESLSRTRRARTAQPGSHAEVSGCP